MDADVLDRPKFRDLPRRPVAPRGGTDDPLPLWEALTFIVGAILLTICGVFG